MEVVFGFWALVLVAFIGAKAGSGGAVAYLDSRNFTEPMFVFLIMVIAATRPILQTTRAAVALLARALPLPGSIGTYFIVLALVPLLGSFITGPAAMTLAALILSRAANGLGTAPGAGRAGGRHCRFPGAVDTVQVALWHDGAFLPTPSNDQHHPTPQPRP